MKLGACYNVFDGIELLEYSIKSIRDNVDYIVVVYQTTSNYGEQMNIKPQIESLLKKKLIDHMILYTPNMKLIPKQNETIKRNIGLKDIRSNNCTHHMNLDTDEFFISEQLAYAKNKVEKNKYDATVVKNIRYYKYPTIQIDTVFDDYFPCIYSVNGDLRDAKWKILADPSRKKDAKKIYIFRDDEITMHHMWMVRKDMHKKFNNKSSRFNFNKQLSQTLQFYNSYEYGKDVKYFKNSKLEHYKSKIVDNIFDIELDKNDDSYFKIFAIGLNKTGTTSLTKAFEILNMKMYHKAIDLIPMFKRQKQTKIPILSHIIYKYDGFSDHPIPQNFKELDKLYPNSKFIFTDRDLESWLISREKHVKMNQRNRQYKGSFLKIDKEAWTNEYLKHKKNVEEYFKDRPDDLLYMNIIDGDGWKKLCPFLNKEIPNTNFPYENERK